MKNIVLIGFMGTGKTSVGKSLGTILKKDVVDVDAHIEELERRKIREIFENEGEVFFRKLEKEAIEEISKKEGIVITTGGGAVQDPDNVEALRKNGVLIALWAAPETILKRVKGSKHRPLLNAPDPLKEIRGLLEKRKSNYEKADFHFHTDRKTSAEVAKIVLEELKKSDKDKHELF